MPPPPSSGELAAVAERSLRWLARQSASVGQRAEAVGLLLRIGVAGRIGEALTGVHDRSATSTGAFERAGNLLDRLDRASAFRLLLREEAAVVLQAGLLLAADGRQPSALTEFTRGLASSIAGVDDEDLFESRCLLAAAGHGQPVPPVPLHPKRLGSTLELLRADGQVMEHVTRDIARASSFGTHELLSEDDAVDVLAAVLPVWIIDLSRRYTLDRVAQIGRSLSYVVGQQASSVTEVVRFLCAQQQPSGCFGFLGPELARRRIGNVSADTDQVFATLTLECLRTLAETTTPFRLLGAGSRAAPARSREPRGLPSP